MVKSKRNTHKPPDSEHVTTPKRKRRPKEVPPEDLREAVRDIFRYVLFLEQMNDPSSCRPELLPGRKKTVDYYLPRRPQVSFSESRGLINPIWKVAKKQFNKAYLDPESPLLAFRIQHGVDRVIQFLDGSRSTDELEGLRQDLRHFGFDVPSTWDPAPLAKERSKARSTLAKRAIGKLVDLTERHVSNILRTTESEYMRWAVQYYGGPQSSLHILARVMQVLGFDAAAIEKTIETIRPASSRPR